MAISVASTALHPGKKLAKVCITILAVLVFTECSSSIKPQQALPYYNTADFTALWMNEAHFNADSIHHIQAFEFTDQHGSPVNSKMMEGKIYVANFFFTSCGGICPRMTSNMKIVADSFRNNQNVLFLSHSVTAEKDSIPVLKKYAEQHGVDSKQWHLLTGNSTTINTLARQSYFIEKLPGLSRDSTEFLHTENLVLVDRKGHIRGLYKGTLELDAYRLIDDINILLKE